jgi:hypothetical protein
LLECDLAIADAVRLVFGMNLFNAEQPVFHSV